MIVLKLCVNGTARVEECTTEQEAQACADDWIAAYRKSGYKYAEFAITRYEVTGSRESRVTYDVNGIRHETTADA